MIKIYLDQKDYINISKAIIFGDNSNGYIDIYNNLVGLTNERKITTYFSAIHIYESLKYKGDSVNKITTFCDVVESLTRGNCIILYDDIERIEIMTYLANIYMDFTFNRPDQFPYGKYIDSILSNKFAMPNDILDFEGRIKAQCLVAINDPLDRLAAELIINDRNAFANLIAEMPHHLYQQHFNLDKKIIIEAIVGTVESRLAIINSIQEKFFNFHFLLLEFKKQATDLYAHISRQIEKTIEFSQLINNTSGRSRGRLDIQRMRYEIGRKAFVEIYGQLKEIIKENKLDPSVIGKKPVELFAFEHKTYTADLFIAYFEQFNAKCNANKHADVNDYIDLFHARSSKYVDIYSTDRKISPAISRVANRYNVTVVDNLHDLFNEVNIRLAHE